MISSFHGLGSNAPILMDNRLARSECLQCLSEKAMRRQGSTGGDQKHVCGSRGDRFTVKIYGL
jgi:hypothetical protein